MWKPLPRVCLLACVTWLPTACFWDGEVVFPDGLGPLEENTAPWPQGSRGERYPETLSLLVGEDDAGLWGHGRAYVQAPVDLTWEALQDIDVIVDRQHVDEWSVTMDVEPGFDFSCRIHNVVQDVVTVEWDLDWREGVAAGSAEEPSAVGVRFEKTEGSAFIEVMAGSIALYQVEDNTTALELIERLDAFATDEEDIRGYLEDLYVDILQYTRGEPLPSYD